jgi:hypothetical protein
MQWQLDRQCGIAICDICQITLAPNGTPFGSDVHACPTPRYCKGLSSTDIDCHQKGRRGSTPQPPDRQPREVAGSGSETPSDSQSSASTAPENAPAPSENQMMTDDDLLLQFIESWPTLSAARKKMIAALIRP